MRGGFLLPKDEGEGRGSPAPGHVTFARLSFIPRTSPRLHLSHPKLDFAIAAPSGWTLDWDFEEREAEEGPERDDFSAVWYLATFGGLILLFLAVTLAEWCCTLSEGRCRPPPPTPPPPYDLFAPPPYPYTQPPQIFVIPVPVHEPLKPPPPK